MEILEIGHFQFVTGLLQFAAGLHAGFALTDSFRNLPKKKFDQFASNWKRISDPETSNTGIKKISAEEKVRSYVADINADGDLVAQKKAKLSLKWAVWLFGFSAVLSLLPLPIFSPVNWALFASYVFFLLLACIACACLIYHYFNLCDFWEQKLNEINRTAKLFGEQEISREINQFMSK